ncbi:LacI family transcriptional regulator [Caldicoprobacter guelmensis]|uniref:LacI family DNA-binding transcriptional regulator n=1 Tax=Caldicoprobacter guelmensis TaxID=1170224 RepID=UPI00195DAEBE|nr:LacI family DNA-binding transcriptional regulator [Caldicoprobacter guelmensis]MBM7581620.1 LacI family transcriptional regulator [Caldicoprobacter guelmensis]
MATIKDVARRAGVSPSTVSRALSGRVPVDKETKERVMEAVRALNYKPNVLAKGLKEGKTNTIGLIVPNICNPVFPAVARGVEDVARERGFTVILCNTDENIEAEKDYVEKLQKRWVDGFIFATAREESHHILELKEKGFPVVLVVRHMAEVVDAVVIDNYKSSLEAVRYLISTGHRRICIVNGDTSLTLYRERFEGYRHALEAAGLGMEPDLVLDAAGRDDNGYGAVMAMLKKGVLPDAVFATSDPKAIGAIRAIKDYGLRVPEDVSVVGFDDLDISAFLDPPLTTVSQPLYEMGARAAQRLISLINGEKPDKPQMELVQAKLVIRKSVKVRGY